MVLFVDLDDDDVEPPEHLGYGATSSPHWSQSGLDHNASHSQVSRPSEREALENLNLNKNSMTEALGCYPIISAIASSIDLNTLDNLSRTCRQVRANLIQFRKQLITQTLRCSNEHVVPNRDHTLRYRARAADWYFLEVGGSTMVGKVGNCARDMVAECRRCSRVVCRNCTIKPPAPVLLVHRHRRLCPACIKAPLPSLLSPHLNESGPMTKDFINREICLCPTEGVWLCQPCGRGLRSADNTYDSIWRWRTRYNPALGGLGTGIGEGNRSFECGRSSECVAARLVPEEIDCDAEDARESDSTNASPGPGLFEKQTRLSSSPTPSTGSSSSAHMGPGYARHEIEGIGGVMKKKLVRMVKVGACVTEWEDERDQGKYLVREVEGGTRSWCGWCWRVIPGAKDIEKWKEH